MSSNTPSDHPPVRPPPALPDAVLILTTESDHMPRNASRSRFLVNKVEGEGTPEPASSPTEVDALPIDDASQVQDASTDDVPSTPARVGRQGVHFNVGPERVSTNAEGNQQTLGNYGTANFKSFQAVQTLEKIPNVDHYRNVMSIQGAMAARPTLQELHDDEENRKHEESHLQHFERFGQIEGGKTLEKETTADPLQPTIVGQKFGWIQGVLMRCVLSILGTMLYLRISWVAGAAGIGFGTLIILVSAVVIVITTLSMSAICTNGEIRGGGAYYMISRSLGPEFGGSIGMIFSLANAVASAMCLVGFAEVVRDMMKNEYQTIIVDGEINDVRIISYCTLVLILCVVTVGVSFESKAQLVLLVVLALSIVDYVIGTFIPPDDDKRAKGMTGYSIATLSENFYPDWRDQSFFSVFSVFFPACTGIMAGANISGDLSDPQHAIPKGTLLAILICMLIYTGAIWTCGATFVREIFVGGNFTLTELSNVTSPVLQYGLLHNFQIMEISGAWRPLVTAGIFAATLSSALAAFVSAPKVFQAVCKDRLFPFIHVFGKGYGANDEPRWGYVLTGVIAVAVIAIGSLNAIAPIISNFFLMSYALVNYACFDASFAGSPGFRPGFRYYNKWVSLVGAVMCLAVMFVISWWNALITFGFVTMLYVYVLHRKPDVNWGSSTQAHAYKQALQAAQKLASRDVHVKNYRPQILLLTGNPVARPGLVDFASNITKDSSLLICGHVVPMPPTARLLASIDRWSRQLYDWFEKRRVKAFYVGVARPNLRDGVQCILQVSGLGKLKPNVVLLGFKNNWRETALQDQSNVDYFNIIHDAFENNCGVGILRLQNGLDVSHMMSEHNVGDTQVLRIPEPSYATNIDAAGSGMNLMDSNRQLSPDGTSRTRAGASESSSFADRIFAVVKGAKIGDTSAADTENGAHKEKDGAEMKLLHSDEVISDQEQDQDEAEDEEEDERLGVGDADDDDDRPATPPKAAYLRNRRMTKQQKEIMLIMDQFKIKVKKPVVHVYWLFDDGGLGLLVPHLLTVPKSYLENAKLSVFTVAASRSQLQKEQRSMAALLSRFRIEYSDVFVIPDLAKKPQKDTIQEFESFIAPFRAPPELTEKEDETAGDSENSISAQGYITDVEYSALRAKTYRQLRIREILLQHSCDATLIVVTLPVPRRGILTSSLYMAWLDFMTKNLPPVLLLRGNQQSVLTFYS